jgi:hypothetical protein
MKRLPLAWKCLIFATGSLLLAGCMKTGQARVVGAEGFLVNPAILSKSGNEQAQYRYQNPQINLNNYSSVFIEPLKLFKPAHVSAQQLADLQKLAGNFNHYLGMELSSDYSVVTTPAAGSLRIESVITEAGRSRPDMEVIPAGMADGQVISGPTDFITVEPVPLGEISGEFKVSDAVTGELIFAVVDSRVGGKSPVKGRQFSSWKEADNAMAFWARKLRYYLCTSRDDAGCGQTE